MSYCVFFLQCIMVQEVSQPEETWANLKTGAESGIAKLTIGVGGERNGVSRGICCIECNKRGVVGGCAGESSECVRVQVQRQRLDV